MTVWTNFFDDYTVVCREVEKQNVDFYVPEFASVFHSLGLNFEFSCFHRGEKARVV